MSEGEDDGVREVHLVGVLVDRRRDHGRVDDDGVIGGQGFAAQLDGGVLRGKVDADVFVEDEGDPDLTCGEADPIFVSRFFLPPPLGLIQIVQETRKRLVKRLK